MKKEYFVVSHTHWDREWYQSFDLFRMRLVDLMDHLLDVLSSDEKYVFFMDAQTVVLEDYLEIKPYKKSELEKHILSGQLIVGPWYVQNDFYLCSGESTIRNLLIGTEIAEDYGKCCRVGYCADQFGNIGQLPQIIKKFGLKGFVFGRGNKNYEKTADGWRVKPSPVEFYWQGADGTKVESVCMPRWYNNAQRFSENIENAKKLIDINEEEFSKTSVVPFRLMMNGVDHLEAQENLLPILEKLNKELDNAVIYQGRLDAYIDRTFDYIEKNNIDLPVIEGELRNGDDGNVLQGTLSSRIYLKQGNEKCENILINKLEPLYEMLKCNGMDIYQPDYLKYLWKELVKNHAHDSICGCSTDAVHRQMEERFFRINQTAEELLKRAMKNVVHHSDVAWTNNDDYIIALANTTQNTVSETVTLNIEFLRKEEVNGFNIFDESGKPVKFTVKPYKDGYTNVYDAINLPAKIAIRSYETDIAIENMKPFSFKYLVVRPNNSVKLESPIQKENGVIENAKYSISVNPDGTITFSDKARNKVVENFLRFEDTADIGQNYVFMGMEGDTPLTSVGKLNSYHTVSSSLEEKLILNYQIKIPEEIVDDKRSDNLIEHSVEVTLTLSNVNDRISVDYNFNNKASDHRLRFIINTGIKSDYTTALSAFETVERRIGEVEMKGVRGADLPNFGLIMQKENDTVTAIYNFGLHEYEQISSNGEIAITVLRSTGILGQNKKNECCEDRIVPGCQSIREISGSFSLEFNKTEAESINKLNTVRTGIITGYDSRDRLKFTSMASAQQTTALNEWFTRPDPYQDCKINSNESIFDIDNENVSISALKREFSGNKTVLRVYNTTKVEQTVNIKIPKCYSTAQLVLLNEKVIDNIEIKAEKITLSLSKAEISTIVLS